MRLPVEFKLRELPHFYEHLRDSTWSLQNVGEGRERELLQRFPHVARVFAGLTKCCQDVIVDICSRMANGMCEFLTARVVTRADYDLYCHYVAGLVGHGLTRLFVACGFEDTRLLEDLSIPNHMGLFLQKTNIIRDFYEDICEDPPRIFWPREIWGQYTDDLNNFKGEAQLQLHEEKARECLNAMVADALVHVPHVITYMASLQEPSIFAFCAIPQVMAMATLAAVFNNAEVFYSKVKISRGATCSIVVNATTLQAALRMMQTYIQQLADRVGPQDVCYDEITERVREAVRAIEVHLPPEDDGVTRSLLTRYPALGGRLLYSLVDNIVGYLGK
ncbi:farnesyltransferase [Trypanosoma theileri]|uniref:Squalene synthase n=1 Tax=Trypanosoma theileri TaxID=67003 RepID=A0A1X0NJX0_9TRYP|nr:farnesyltransferase [Trypanosoma theileri]ORC84479.1 farnesyltransferase [Trypanosoma theileri]